jgi:hypothetical protein
MEQRNELGKTVLSACCDGFVLLNKALNDKDVMLRQVLAQAPRKSNSGNTDGYIIISS